MADALSVPDGGFSVRPEDGGDVRTGYAVAVHPEHERVLTGPVSVSDLHSYVSDVRDALRMPGRVLGGWHDPDGGRIYLDVSVVVADLSDAIELGERHGQLAIFDFDAMESIPLTPVALAA
jgi:hypothetical protein